MVSAAAYQFTVGDALRKQATVRPDATAVEADSRSFSYRQLNARVNRLANALVARGVKRGDRVAVLAENCLAYLELELAAAKLGAIVPCLNWRLAAEELCHCIRLTSPVLMFVSARYAGALARIEHGVASVVGIEQDYERLLQDSREDEPAGELDPEDGLVILYTSGTTGLPKGAVISQRAMVARAMCFAGEYGIAAEHTYVAWSPMFHMAATDFSLSTIMIGGKVVIQDGLDIDRLCATIGRESIGWLVAMPGMIDVLIDGLRRNRTQPRGMRVVGAMADLVPLQQIAELTGLLNAPYINSFGATETGLAPASGGRLTPGVVPTSLAKRESAVLQRAPGRCRRPRRAGGHARRSGGARADAVLRLLECARGQRPRLPRRLVSHGRPVRAPARRHARLRRPRQVPDQVGRREHLSGRDRTRAAGAGALWPMRRWCASATNAGAKCRWPSSPSSPVPVPTPRRSGPVVASSWQATRSPRNSASSSWRPFRAAAPAKSSDTRSSACGCSRQRAIH